MTPSTQDVLPWSVIATAGWLKDLTWRARQGSDLKERPAKNPVM